MRSLVLLSALCVTGWLIPGCGTSEKGSTTATKTYQCPGCKDTVTWTYGTGPVKGIPTGQKTVTHTCTMCKKEWVAACSPTNNCAMCNMKEAKCPDCSAHGS